MKDSGPGAANLDNVVIVLDRPKDVVNVAGVVRVMMNMGLSRLRLVSPDDFDTYRIGGIAHRSEELTGAAETFETLQDALSDVVLSVATSARPRTDQRNYVRPREIAPRIVEGTASGLVALVFGREDRGLTNEGLDLCQSVAIVPTAAEYPSLNLAQACLVLCYEIHLAGSEETPLPRGKRDQGPATQKDLEEMYSALHRGLSRIDFFKGDRHPESVMRLLRTILSRAEPDLREARLVRAMGFEMERYFDREGAESEPDT
ncbi:MAG: TrmJ/YjtD family RNA methyltransferase [Gemmatimonadetes bacterium]|nr:TrmJ/YjtD family RNA methyltransferase [Gemmatimonadota bacterium]MCH8810335.1 TrmJ/YjtD family RNA methyltransferase [Gemmatimonadota bacterium]